MKARLVAARLGAAAVIAAAVGTGFSSAVAGASGSPGQRGQPDLEDAKFAPTSNRIDNPWFPQRPGTVRVYVGAREGLPAREILTVTRKTRVISGVRCAVLNDRLFVNGRLHERTTDWYAQDTTGTVWYLGEATAELNRQGRVISTAGSFQAGRDGARAGIYMPAHPRVGQSFQQELYPGQAEDHFRVLSRSAKVSTPVASSRRALLTAEWTPLEPGHIDHKLYVRGVGSVKEMAVKGVPKSKAERLELVSMRTR